MIIKTISILAISGIMLLGRNSYSQRVLAASDNTTKNVQQIREQYKIVNANQAKYRLLEKDLTGESTEGGFIAAFFDQQALRKLRVTYYGETGKVMTEYYFNGSDLFFSFVKEYHYNKPIDQPGSRVTSVKEDRCYFVNKKMIRWLQGNDLKMYNMVVYNEMSINLLTESKRLLTYILNCKSTSRNALVQDTVRCKYSSDCPSTGYILKGSRNSCGEAMHVSPKHQKFPLE